MTSAKRLLIGLSTTVLLMGIGAALLFGFAGRTDLPMFWAALAAWFTLSLVLLLGIDADLLRERVRPGPGGRDYGAIYGMQIAIVLHLIVAGLDVGRYHGSAIPLPAQIAALAIFLLAGILLAAAMITNRFFSPVIRIQSERGHHLITAGPYRFVRHPGYTAAIILALADGIALGSWWSVVPMILFAALILRRAILEDRFLREHLEDYADYAARVRWRLLPGIW